MKDGKAGVAMGEGESFFPSPIHPSFTVSERDLIQDKGLPTGSKLREKSDKIYSRDAAGFFGSAIAHQHECGVQKTRKVLGRMRTKILKGLE